MSIAQLKQSDCRHQWPDNPECVPSYRNEYHCEECDESWTDCWSCMCNDKCPSCNAEIEPHNSTVVAPCACDDLDD